MNERQRHVLNRVLDGFDGKLTTSKWAKLAKCSQDTALRDILPLVGAGILVRNREGGRSTSYRVGKIEEAERKKNERTQNTHRTPKGGEIRRVPSFLIRLARVDVIRCVGL